ncbi:putative SANT domain-containing protein [Cryptosporidium canis]|uniref:SANT domain-containing protein n=1 Tax=Cryptosporidium canis TaxID=195482 RepID=A0A9D5DIB6_9CRYT|nr:putative SANT domain-containing protein [Cryptosporidium canis]
MKKNPTVTLSKSKSLTNNKSTSQNTQNQVDKVTNKGSNSNILSKTGDQAPKKNTPESNPDRLEKNIASRFDTNLDDSNLSYNISFHIPSYNFMEIPEPKVRNEIVRRKISKLESYLSLCEELYLGNISKTKSVSDIFQSLIVSHNIEPEDQYNAFLKRQSSATGFSKQNTKANSKNSQSFEPITNAESIISPLSLLTHPFRNKEVIDLWGPHEVILFECGVCKYGKEFDKIQRIIKTKTTKEIVDFYYCIWKRTSRYKAWKSNRQLSEYIFS